jgi:hypothetical protein
MAMGCGMEADTEEGALPVVTRCSRTSCTCEFAEKTTNIVYHTDIHSYTEVSTYDVNTDSRTLMTEFIVVVTTNSKNDIHGTNYHLIS